ncbi:MAG: hypothetical protein GXY82_01185 [Methanospirillum sp.]|nr:hypothetical protein [Methanospirillum sp.]
MKRDPLQRGPTPYDLLGVEPGSGVDESVYTGDTGVGIPEGTATDAEREVARSDLTDPVRRAIVDLFYYQDRYLDELAFNDPIESLSVTPARRSAAERWRAVERRGFPISAATHSIAVLSYWEARASGRNGPDLPTPPDVTGRLWQAALTRFAALCASDGFWTEWGILSGNRASGDSGNRVAEGLEARLTEELEGMAETLRDRGDVPGEGRAREHLALFRTELRAARNLQTLRVISGRGLSPVALAAGPVLLEEVGLLEKVQASVGEQRPELLPLFSPLARIEGLIDDREYESALGAIERLDDPVRETEEVRDLEGRVRLALGQRAIDEDRVDEAIGHWERAHAISGDRSSVAAPLSTAALARAKLLNSREDHDGAIALLQRAMPFGEREVLALPLAHFLLERADARIERAAALADEEDPGLSRAVAEMRGAVVDLEEAVELDPTNGGIRDRRNEAEDQLQALLLRSGGEIGDAPVVSPADEEAPTPGVGASRGNEGLSKGSRRAVALTALGIALWVGIGILALVAYPLLMPRYLGATGLVIGIAVSIGWIVTNAVGWVLLR